AGHRPGDPVLQSPRRARAPASDGHRPHRPQAVRRAGAQVHEGPLAVRAAGARAHADSEPRADRASEGVMRTLANVTLTLLCSLLLCCHRTVDAPRVVVLGIDGMDPELLRGFMDAGKMPNFAALAAEGG